METAEGRGWRRRGGWSPARRLCGPGVPAWRKQARQGKGTHTCACTLAHTLSLHTHTHTRAESFPKGTMFSEHKTHYATKLHDVLRLREFTRTERTRTCRGHATAQLRFRTGKDKSSRDVFYAAAQGPNNSPFVSSIVVPLFFLFFSLIVFPVCRHPPAHPVPHARRHTRTRSATSFVCCLLLLPTTE